MGVKHETPLVALSKPDEVRCGCGALLARQIPGGLELKCRRCRRVICLRFDDLPSDPNADPIELEGGCGLATVPRSK